MLGSVSASLFPLLHCHVDVFSRALVRIVYVLSVVLLSVCAVIFFFFFFFK